MIINGCKAISFDDNMDYTKHEEIAALIKARGGAAW
jgi:hypothetical protein